ncbi:MFS family permease [Metabacillus crassostreae]|uniref:MFS transporter n=1 Tax=Metabacillus crassostreae TaxID=929098 RepID=UPI0019584358|nr:MFS transporter [Metabacillus crassostreae]MBM7605146.1 MFS family permease [Metabacillus crassostreae]
MTNSPNDSKELTSNRTDIQSYMNDPQKQSGLYRRTLIIIVIAQIFGGAGLAAGITVGALLAKEMLGTDSFSGVPIALFTLGSAGAALLVGRLSQRYGRRPGLTFGFFAGGIGAIGVIISAITNNIIFLFISLLIYGAGTATNLQARYAGTDLAHSTQRATAISIAMVSTTFGAVAGPNLVGIMGDFASTIGIPSLAGPFILAAAAYFLAGFVLLILLRPDPLVVAKAIAAAATEKANTRKHSDVSIEEESINNNGILVGASVMILTQVVMVAIMTMTPVHMGHHGHGLDEVGMIIGIHIGAMYLPSLFTGILVDKIGRIPMSIVAGITLLTAGILAATAPTDSMLILTISLALLGLGWNFGLISGTALLVDATNSTNRAKIQGAVDVFIALAGAAGGVLSGVIVAYTSYPTLSLAGGALSLVLILIIILFRNYSKD